MSGDREALRAERREVYRAMKAKARLQDAIIANAAKFCAGDMNVGEFSERLIATTEAAGLDVETLRKAMAARFFTDGHEGYYSPSVEQVAAEYTRLRDAQSTPEEEK